MWRIRLLSDIPTSLVRNVWQTSASRQLGLYFGDLMERPTLESVYFCVRRGGKIKYRHTLFQLSNEVYIIHYEFLYLTNFFNRYT